MVASEGIDLPLLQDVDEDNDGLSDVMKELWQVEYRDIVILNADNEPVGFYNLTVHDLATEDYYNDLKQKILNAAGLTPTLLQPIVTLNTNMGSISFELLYQEAPQTVANFLNYVDSGEYISSFFHRSITDFVVQGGGFKTPAAHLWTLPNWVSVNVDDPVDNEPGISNTRGTVAMAKVGGQPDSATSQFFVNLNDNNTFLDTQNGGFSVFARVVDMTVPDAISVLPTQTVSPYSDVPFTNNPVTELLELPFVESISGEGTIHGRHFFDANGNGTYESGETGFSGTPIYVDLNNNGVFDLGTEPTTTTNADGRYAFRLAPGTYTIRHQTDSIFTNTTPQQYTVSLGLGRAIDDIDFGQLLAAPTQIDLLPASDTGFYSDDNLTNLINDSSDTALQLELHGVVDGAVVRLFYEGAELGQAIAVDGSAVITTTGIFDGPFPISAFHDGAVHLAATQTFLGIESTSSSIFQIEIDATPPEFTSQINPKATVGALYSYDANTTEEDGTSIHYSLVTAPTGMTVGQTTGRVTWTPTTDQDGLQTVQLRATDMAGNYREQTLDVAVEQNVAPTLSPIGPQTAVEGEEWSLQLSAVDQNLPYDVLTYSLLQGAAAGATIYDDGRLVWTPGEMDGPGTYLFTVQVEDLGGLTTSETFFLEVAEVNQSPTMAPVADQQVEVGQQLEFSVVASDPDRPLQNLQFSLGPGAPAGATLNEDGLFSWVPTSEQIGLAEFVLSVHDNGQPQRNATQTMRVDVWHNEPPSFSAVDPLAIKQGQVLSLQLVAIDPNLPADTLSYSITFAGASGAAINADGLFTWAPAANEVPGTFEFSVKVEDAHGLSDSLTLVIGLIENLSPTLSPINPVTSVEGEQVGLQLSASDANLDEILSYSLSQGTTLGASVDADGLFLWTPTESEGPGTHSFTVTVTDSGGLSASQTFSVTVAEANQPPTMAPIANRHVEVGKQLEFSVVASDPDLPLQNLQFSLGPGAPAGATLDENGLFRWIPTSANVGSNDIVLTVHDSSDPPFAASQTLRAEVFDQYEADSAASNVLRFVAELAARARVVQALFAVLPENFVREPGPNFVASPTVPPTASLAGPVSLAGKNEMNLTGSGGGRIDKMSTETKHETGSPGGNMATGDLDSDEDKKTRKKSKETRTDRQQSGASKTKLPRDGVTAIDQALLQMTRHPID